MVMAVWLTLKVSADGTGRLERPARARGAPDATARLLRWVTNECTRRDHAGQANHEHHVASVTPVTGRAPRDVRERHHWIAEVDHAADQDRTEGSDPSAP
jgi:hypothetical protein